MAFQSQILALVAREKFVRWAIKEAKTQNWCRNRNAQPQKLKAEEEEADNWWNAASEINQGETKGIEGNRKIRSICEKSITGNQYRRSRSIETFEEVRKDDTIPRK